MQAVLRAMLAISAPACGATTNGHPDSSPADVSSADASTDVPLAWPGDSLPCEVATLLARECIGCHFTGSTLAPSSLLSRADLMRPSMADPSRTVAQLSVQRMMDTASPMPPLPSPAVPASAIAGFQNWIDSGSLAGACMVPDPLADPATCPSGSFWSQGDRGSIDMHPGQACTACHTMLHRGPRATVAGTVFPTGHTADNCNAFAPASPIPSTVDIEITDAMGVVSHVSPNASGNFALIAFGFTLPYTARVIYMGRERTMLTPQTDGDCNTCHTQSGANSAPGRITLP